MTKSEVVFFHAVNNDTLARRLTEIMVDDRWRRGQEQFNHELAEHAFVWAKQAVEQARRDSVLNVSTNQDAKLVLKIAIKALEWR